MTDDVDTTGNPYEPDLNPYPGHAAELRTWADGDLYAAWEDRDNPLAATAFTAAIGAEITRRDNATRWRDYGTEHGLSAADADRFATFVDGWGGEDLADALTEFRRNA
ncbi:hypothetical protein [Nocardiopsis tropica]|uniref:Uncharacterized protein n=1 Tax=Nocardiopsis tropica TaxID=109330 RepID=A0ABU7KZD2_9ACTN|nr:hypothetical protein [Nocardiopsis umidischolae]MEE2054666.1 hypothetical protein [Nocardiopsis umidischolae]